MVDIGFVERVEGMLNPETVVLRLMPESKRFDFRAGDQAYSVHAVQASGDGSFCVLYMAGETNGLESPLICVEHEGLQMGNAQARGLYEFVEAGFDEVCHLKQWPNHPSGWDMVSSRSAFMDAWGIYLKQSDGRGHYLELYQHGTLRAVGAQNEEPDVTDDLNRLWRAIVFENQPKEE